MDQKEKMRKLKVLGRLEEPTFVDDKRARKSMQYSTSEGAFNAASSSIHESFITPFALSLGATNAEIGLLSSAKSMASTSAQIPGAKLTRTMSRKSIWIMSTVISKIALWIPIILLPFMAVDNRVIWLIILFAATGFFSSIRSPAWSSLMGDIVHPKIRGNYFSRRNMIAGIAGIVATIAGGYILISSGFWLIFLISVVLSFISIFFFIRMFEPPMRNIFHYKFELSAGKMLDAAKRNANFSFFTIFIVVFNFSIEISGPFIAVLMLQNFGMSYEIFGLVIAIGAIAKILFQSYWGRISRGYSDKKILVVTSLMICFIPFGYLISQNTVHIIVVRIYDSFAFAGFELVMFNMLLGMTPAEKRPSYIGVHNFIAGIGTILGALLGAFIVTSVGSSAFLVTAGLGSVFLVSFILRLASTSLLLKIRNTEFKETDAIPIRYAFVNLVAIEPAASIKHMLDTSFRYPMEIVKKRNRYAVRRDKKRS